MEKLRLLIAEDNELDAALLVRELQRGGYDLVFERVETAEAMKVALTNGTWDLVVSDFSMPRFSALGALALVKEHGLDLPFVIVSGTVSEEVAVEVMRAGAHDFMPKGKFTRLLPAIKRELRDAAGRSERRAIEEQLRQAQKMEAIGNLTGGMAHDFNNLLGIIVGNLELLRDVTKDDAHSDELASEALDAALRGADLTRRLLAFARRQPLRPRLIDINEHVSAITKLLARTLGEQITIDLTLDDHVWLALADPGQLEASLTNLATNARDAMPKGGRLAIRTANRELDEEYTAQHAEVLAGRYAMIEVSDTGFGMSPETLNRIFEPFFTTKDPDKGTGLGLSMVFGFMKQSGGHISVYSEVGIGTTFRLYLPKATETKQEEPVAANVGVSRGNDECVLVVEDNERLRRIVVRQLTDLGYRILEAEDAKGALAVLEERKVDVLLTDIVMPGGTNGLELARMTVARWPATKVVLTSGFPDTSLTGSGGFNFYLLSKPYRRDDLARTMREALEAEGPGRTVN